MKNDYLIERKENIFGKISKFFKGLFHKEDVQVVSEPVNISEKEVNQKSDFLDYIRIKDEEDAELVELQKRFENKEILMKEIPLEKLVDLLELYERQISKLEKENANKKVQIGMLKFRLTGSVN